MRVTIWAAVYVPLATLKVGAAACGRLGSGGIKLIVYDALTIALSE